MSERNKKVEKKSKTKSDVKGIRKIFAWLENPNNLGTIQVILALNTVLLSFMYYLFQKFFGVDPWQYAAGRISASDVSSADDRSMGTEE